QKSWVDAGLGAGRRLMGAGRAYEQEQCQLRWAQAHGRGGRL
ncbi:hypothetical protein A2U01_0056140, partial [Trifolium medium]|nr:hypothetical protein [Trifolium medium]